MTPGQLIDLLAEAGMLKEESPGVFGWQPTMERAERFVGLVRAAEREACAQVCEEWLHGQWHNQGVIAATMIRARGEA